jgi:hypothetical protein
MPRSRRVHTSDHLEDSAFTRPVAPDESYDLAFCHPKGNVLESFEILICLPPVSYFGEHLAQGVGAFLDAAETLYDI